MKPTLRSLTTLCLACVSLAAQAGTVNVSFSTSFSLPATGIDGNTLAISFALEEPLAGVLPEGPEAFRLLDVLMAVDLNGSSMVNSTNAVGWFDYAAPPPYRGIDIRLSNLLVTGDQLQLIMSTGDALYSGGSATPTLERISLTGMGGYFCYYTFDNPSCAAEGPMSSTSYRVAAATEVPEPSAAWLAGLGLLSLGMARRRLAG